jgi:hypothetical protein
MHKLSNKRISMEEAIIAAFEHEFFSLLLYFLIWTCQIKQEYSH